MDSSGWLSVFLLISLTAAKLDAVGVTEPDWSPTADSVLGLIPQKSVI